MVMRCIYFKEHTNSFSTNQELKTLFIIIIVIVSAVLIWRYTAYVCDCVIKLN